MPIINIEYNDNKVQKDDVLVLSNAVQKITDEDKLINEIKSRISVWKN